ncbi:hypothetical protein Q1695_003286 [Nippostrongylus brasiliensis]|nr:hypothetical protein Q1695_003286 [Nippostrongylus brasiliensis]
MNNKTVESGAWHGRKLVECRHGDYSHTRMEWLLMCVLLFTSVVICILAYYSKRYADCTFQLELLLDTLPTKEIVKRYNRYKEGGEEEKVQEMAKADDSAPN